MLGAMETYFGQVRTPQDAIILFEACRIGLLPRVQRRLSEKERQQIRSGSVFVWDEREAGMRRWTDGKSWSASRVSGSFLTYREMEGKRGGFNQPGPPENGKRLPGINNKTMETAPSETTEEADAPEEGEGPDGYRYKPDGLMKQSFSITTQDNRHLHLISYYSRSPSGTNLPHPTSDQNLRNIRPQKGMYPETNVSETNATPAVTIGPLETGASWPATAGAPPRPAQRTQHSQHTQHAQQLLPHHHNPYPHHPPPQHYPYPPPPHGYPHPSQIPPWAHGPNGQPHHYPPPGYYPHHPGYAYYPPPQHTPPHHYPPPPVHPSQQSQHNQPPPLSYPTPPSSTLPPLLNGHATSAPASLRSPPGTSGYPSPPSAGSSLRQNPYGSGMAERNASSAPSDPALQAPASGPVASSPRASNGAPKPPLKPFTAEQGQKPVTTTLPPSNLPRTTTAPSAIAERSTANGTTIPSITSLLGGSGNPPVASAQRMENGNRSPTSGPLPGIGMLRAAPNPHSGAVTARDKSDLKRLDSHSLKFN